MVLSLFETAMPPGLIYVPEWLSDSEHDALICLIDGSPFDESLMRRVQHYGARYNYESSAVELAGSAPPIPQEIKNIGERLFSEGFFSRPPEQVIVNEYIGSQGIAPHIDRTSFGEAVATVSLNESWSMKFRGPNEETSEILLEKKSLAVMTQLSRYEWTHEIPKRKYEVMSGMRRLRHRRISLTFRTIGS
jgi:alkylated DNA repair dioxygenase AlkB